MIARSPREGWLLLGLVALAVVLPLAVTGAAGALDVPYSDDFTFRRTASALFETGQVRLGGWSIMTFVGQLAFVQPFLWLSGGQPWAFSAAAAALTALGVLAGWALARRLLPPGRAALTVLAVLLFPGFLQTVPTFMTDIPAWAAELACLALGAVALRPRGPGATRWLAASLAVGLWAFSIREFGLAAPVAVLVAAGIGGRFPRRTLAVAWVLTLGACLGLYAVTSRLPGQVAAPLSGITVAHLNADRQVVATVALILAPAMVLAIGGLIRQRAWRTAWGSRWSLAGAALGLALVIPLYWTEILTVLRSRRILRVLVGNLFEIDGSTGNGGGVGDRPTIFAFPWWDLANLAALVAVVVGFVLLGAAAGVAIRSWRGDLVEGARRWAGTSAGLLAIFASLYWAGILAFGMVASMYDRYLWPVIVPLAILLLRLAGDPASAGVTNPAGTLAVPVRAASALAVALSIVLSLALAGASLAILANRAAYDAARWEAATTLVGTGYRADTIDAGMEWVGFHATALAAPGTAPAPGQRWYNAWFPSFRLCALVASSAQDDPTLEPINLAVRPYRLLLIAGPEEPLLLYRSTTPGCP